MKQCNSSKKLSICWYWAFAIVTIRSHHHSHLSIILFWLPFQWHCHQLVFLFHRTSHHAPSVFNVAALSLHKLSKGCVVGPLLFIMYTTPQLVTLALSFMNISPSLTKSQHFLNPAIFLFVHFVVSVLTSIKKKQPVPSPHPLSILNLTTATLFIIIFLTPNYTDSIWFKTLLPVLIIIIIIIIIFFTLGSKDPEG